MSELGVYPSESCCLGVQHKVGGKEHRRLNMSERPIANKYCEGKVKRTRKRELIGLEIVVEEANGGQAPVCIGGMLGGVWT